MSPNMNNTPKPHPLVSLIPVVVLIALLAVVIALFGSDSLSGGSQIALILGMAVCVLISTSFYHVPWRPSLRPDKAVLLTYYHLPSVSLVVNGMPQK